MNAAITGKQKDYRTRRNIIVLAIAQGLYGSGAIIVFTLAALTGQMLSVNKALATLPITAYILGAAVTIFPASMFMQRFGRRRGFMTGAAMGMAGAGLAVFAIYEADFALFTAALFIAGAFQAFSSFYRFAAADTASDAFKPKAISWVLVGGVAAAFAGPQIAIWSKDMLAPYSFAGAFAAAMGLSFIAFVILSFIDIPRPVEDHFERPPRPLPEIIKNPRFMVAVICAMVSYAIMNLVMTATPLSIVACGFSVSDAAFVIQWHVVAMFAPGFFTGNLIVRFGVERIISAGLLLLAGCGIVALSGVSLSQFWAALVLLGLGWNFAFIGATTMLTQCYRPEEKAKAQGINDLAVFGSVALASLLSGVLFQNYGWDSVNITVFPFVIIALLLILWLANMEKRTVQVP